MVHVACRRGLQADDVRRNRNGLKSNAIKKKIGKHFKSPKHFFSSLGKLIGGFCALSGTFILTLPIPIVVNSFAGYYKNRLWRNEVAQKKRERAMAQATEAREMQKLYLVQAMAGPLARDGMTLAGLPGFKK